MPDGPFLPARLLKSPRLGFGVTTVALVALASGSTGILVSHGTNQLQPAAPHAVAPRPASPPARPVLVDRAPGSLLLPQVDRTVPAVPAAVAPAPRQPSSSAQLPRVQASPPPAPVVGPPVVTTPPPPPDVMAPPVVAPPVLDPNAKGSRKKPHPPHPDDQGKHLGQLKH